MNSAGESRLEKAQGRPLEVPLSDRAMRAIARDSETGVEAWKTRCSLCELIAYSLRYPDDELIEVVSSGQWLAAAEQLAHAAQLKLGDGWAGEVQAFDLHKLRTESTRLFIGMSEPACEPYEGVWRTNDDGIRPLMFVNTHTMNVERFMKKCGLGNAEGKNIPLDHVQTEFELLEYLAGIQGGVIIPFEDGPATVDFPGGGAAQAYAAFMADHAMTWMPRFADRLIETARSPFYVALGCLMRGFLDKTCCEMGL